MENWTDLLEESTIIFLQRNQFGEVKYTFHMTLMASDNERLMLM